jgi:hypothetical protein
MRRRILETLFWTLFAGAFLALAYVFAYGDFQPRPSRLTAGLPSNFETARIEFDGRIKRAFPPGTPEADLVSALAKSGFETSEARTASLTQPDGPCLLVWYVSWEANQGALREVMGIYGDRCP